MRKPIKFWVFAILVTAVLVLNYQYNKFLKSYPENKALLKTIDDFIKSRDDANACNPIDWAKRAPNLALVKEKPVDCSEASDDLVVVNGSQIMINKRAHMSYLSLTCSVCDVIRVDDFMVKENIFKNMENTYDLNASDVVSVFCEAGAYSETWTSVLMGTRYDKSILERTGWTKLPSNALKLNVLMFGFASLSRNAFIEKLPKSYKYLTEILGAQVLEGYTNIGAGSLTNLIAILTGKKEKELPDTRRKVQNTSYVDVYPFIWNNFSQHGYVTAFLEDMPIIGIFSQTMKGFQKQPTDHYMRPYYMKALFFTSPKLCFGSTPRHKLMTNYIKNFFSVYKNKPKFLFGFYKELSRKSNNLVGKADGDVLEFLTYLHESGMLSNTILIVMADRGRESVKTTNIVGNSLSDVLPFFSITLPESFKKEHKEAFNNFIQNTKRLTTPFDIHATLLNVLDNSKSKSDFLYKRSISLFSEIPEKRSCVAAGIDVNWCPCVIDVVSFVQNLVNTVIKTINKHLIHRRPFCSDLSLNEVILVIELKPAQYMLSFNHNNVKARSKIYAIKILLKPGNFIYLATVTHNLDTDIFESHITNIKRLNMENTKLLCVEEEFQPFCYCEFNENAYSDIEN